MPGSLRRYLLLHAGANPHATSTTDSPDLPGVMERDLKTVAPFVASPILFSFAISNSRSRVFRVIAIARVGSPHGLH